LVIFAVFGGPLVRILSGEAPALAFAPRNRTRAVLGRNIDSAPGREDYVRVRVVEGPQGMVAEPLPGKSAAIFSLVYADGYVVVDLHREGLEAGSEVDVILFAGGI
jgi:molybdopterin molybdotransferase